MTEARRHYWEGFVGSTPPGDQLAALRRGVGHEAGTVPQLWRFYTTLRSDGRVTDVLRAEHLALTLYAVHQQSQTINVHRAGVRLGTALRAIKLGGRFSPDAVDRRVLGAATATSLPELSMHLRGLIGLARSLSAPLHIDYSMLFRDLRDWQRPGGGARVRRRWGAAYFATDDPETAPSHDEQEQT